jgi:antirestriction protein ArdC
MPERCFFDSEEAYYSTLFHELAHYAAIWIMPRRWLKASLSWCGVATALHFSGIILEAQAVFCLPLVPLMT